MTYTWKQYAKRQTRPGFADEKPKQIVALRKLEEELDRADVLNWGGVNDAGVAHLRSKVMAQRQVLESMTYVEAVPAVTESSAAARTPAALATVLA